MAKGKEKGGFQSAAGLIRYFDAEDETALRIDPRIVVVLCIFSMLLVYVAGFLFPLS